MPFRCTFPSVIYAGIAWINQDVTTTFKASIECRVFYWYPDTKGRPSIIFRNCGIEWIFDTEEDRDSEYQKLLSAFDDSE